MGLVDGISWTKDDACTSCTAMNVYASPAVIEGVKKFEEATEAEGRRLGDPGPCANSQPCADRVSYEWLDDGGINRRCEYLTANSLSSKQLIQKWCPTVKHGCKRTCGTCGY